MQQSAVSKKDTDSQAQSFYSPQHEKKQTVYEGVGEGGRSMRAMAKSGSLSIWISATHALSTDAVKTFKVLLNLSVSKRNYFKAHDECIQHDAPSALPKYLDSRK